MIRSKKIRKSAEGQKCTMWSPECNNDPATTVWAHSNFMEHGKGRGLKSHDIFGAYLCSGCHHWYDAGKASKEDKREYFYLAMSRSLLKLIDQGIVEVK